ncbi:MAG TPA: GntR family transcriptional regulator [Solirubrobacteraceae bacterium]|nr:GntR family transcriptional regulator [Solirubrobacteraceae bacterium]
MARGAIDKLAEDGSGSIEISIDRDAEVPIGVQLAWALRSRIADGRLTSGMRLPGLRELAESTEVNINTIRTVYQRLEQEGLIDTQHGSGTYVSSGLAREPAAATIAAQAASEARETGVDPRAVAAALYVSSKESDPGVDSPSARRRLLRAQIATLERTLAEMQATHPGLAPAPKQTPSARGPMLLDAAALERVRGDLVRRLAAIQAAIDEPEPTPEPATAAKRPVKRKAPLKSDSPSEAKRSSAKRPTNRPAAAGT